MSEAVNFIFIAAVVIMVAGIVLRMVTSKLRGDKVFTYRLAVQLYTLFVVAMVIWYTNYISDLKTQLTASQKALVESTRETEESETAIQTEVRETEPQATEPITEITTEPQTTHTESSISSTEQDVEVLNGELLAFGSDPETGKWFAPTVDNAQDAVYMNCVKLEDFIQVQYDLRSFLNNPARLNNCKRAVENRGKSSFEWEYKMLTILADVGRKLHDNGVDNVESYNNHPDVEPSDNVDPYNGLTPDQMLVLMTDMEQ